VINSDTLFSSIFRQTHFPDDFLRLGEDAHGENNLVWLKKGVPTQEIGHASYLLMMIIS